ncbi:hypothetical protein NMY22_g11913 [Coprinellus aureogranulatus]|nr:hypothetical protein NMY22_g11913 [Coprinellus aureogranulatus]
MGFTSPPNHPGERGTLSSSPVILITSLHLLTLIAPISNFPPTRRPTPVPNNELRHADDTVSLRAELSALPHRVPQALSGIKMCVPDLPQGRKGTHHTVLGGCCAALSLSLACGFVDGDGVWLYSGFDLLGVLIRRLAAVLACFTPWSEPTLPGSQGPLVYWMDQFDCEPLRPREQLTPFHSSG